MENMKGDFERFKNWLYTYELVNMINYIDEELEYKDSSGIEVMMGLGMEFPESSFGKRELAYNLYSVKKRINKAISVIKSINFWKTNKITRNKAASNENLFKQSEQEMQVYDLVDKSIRRIVNDVQSFNGSMGLASPKSIRSDLYTIKNRPFN